MNNFFFNLNLFLDTFTLSQQYLTTPIIKTVDQTVVKRLLKFYSY